MPNSLQPKLHVPDSVKGLACDAASATADLDRFAKLSTIEQYRAMKRWDFLSLVGYACHSKTGLDSVALFWKARFRAYLDTIVADSDAFIAAMDRTGAVITDHSVMRILDPRIDWPADRVEMATPIDGFDELVAFLVEKESGKIVHHVKPQIVPDFEVMRGVCECMVIKTPRNEFHIERSVTTSGLYPITSAACDFLISAVSSRGFSIRNPAQFVSKRGRRSVATAPNAAAVCLRWTERGYTVLTPHDPGYGLPQMHGQCRRTMRYFGDDESLTFWFRHSADDNSQYAWSAGWLFDGDVCEKIECAANLMPSGVTMLVPRALSIT